MARSPLPSRCLTTTLSVLTSVSLFLCVFCRLVETTPFLVARLQQTRLSSPNGPPLPRTLSSLSYVVCPALYVFLVSLFCLFLLFCVLFLTNFLLSLSFFHRKGRQKTPQPCLGWFLQPPFNTKGSPIISLVFPHYIFVYVCFNLSLPCCM